VGGPGLQILSVPTSKSFGAAAAIFDEAGAAVLLVKHKYGPLNWELPGGAAESGESPAETVVREVLEETGLHVCARSITGWYFEPEIDFLHFVIACDMAHPEAAPVPDRLEVSACQFWPIDELPRPISNFTIRRIADAASGSFLPLPVRFEGRTFLT
jgi:8-oxo-dGTP pyrophosphatase MutT (NUDIX family)